MPLSMSVNGKLLGYLREGVTNLLEVGHFDARTAGIAFTATAHFDETKSVQKTHHNEIFYKSLADGVRGDELAAYVQTQMQILTEARGKTRRPRLISTALLSRTGIRRIAHTDILKTKAILYCRVSSMKQATRGDGLSSQETRCREYAKYKGYEVIQVFKDDMSGNLINRPGMQAMLSFLRKNKRQPHVVIIDDISRLARGLDGHLQLRADIGNAGGILESPSIEFGEDSDSKLVENLLASVSQHQRQKNSEQTRNRMRARVQNGY